MTNPTTNRPTEPLIGLTNRVKIASGRSDKGAGDRGIMIARDLYNAGLWDGEGEIWFNHVYEMHPALSLDKVTLQQLVITQNNSGTHVSLPHDFDPDAVPPAPSWIATLEAARAEQQRRVAEAQAKAEAEQRELERKQGAHLRTVLTLLLGEDPGELTENAYPVPGSPVVLKLAREASFNFDVYSQGPRTDGVQFDESKNGIRFNLMAVTSAPDEDEWEKYDEEWGNWIYTASHVTSNHYVDIGQTEAVQNLRAELAEAIEESERKHQTNLAKLQRWQDQGDHHPADIAGDPLTVEVQFHIYDLEDYDADDNQSIDSVRMARMFSDGWQAWRITDLPGQQISVIWRREVQS